MGCPTIRKMLINRLTLVRLYKRIYMQKRDSSRFVECIFIMKMPTNPSKHTTEDLEKRVNSLEKQNEELMAK